MNSSQVPHFEQLAVTTTAHTREIKPGSCTGSVRTSPGDTAGIPALPARIQPQVTLPACSRSGTPSRMSYTILTEFVSNCTKHEHGEGGGQTPKLSPPSLLSQLRNRTQRLMVFPSFISGCCYAHPDFQGRCSFSETDCPSDVKTVISRLN